jgi:hypothetical protein
VESQKRSLAARENGRLLENTRIGANAAALFVSEKVEITVTLRQTAKNRKRRNWQKWQNAPK